MNKTHAAWVALIAVALSLMGVALYSKGYAAGKVAGSITPEFYTLTPDAYWGGTAPYRWQSQ